MRSTDLKPPSQQNVFKLKLKPELEITVRSDFDSGNLGRGDLILPNTLVLTPANDCTGTIHEGHSIGWFHFKVCGVPAQTSIRFRLKKMHVLSGQAKFGNMYCPVYAYSGSPWQRVEWATVVVAEDDTQVQFEHKFQRSVDCSFAFTIPFSYHDSQQYLRTLCPIGRHQKQIYLHCETMIRSPQLRDINLITISSNQGKTSERESRISEYLFGTGIRSSKFKLNKKVILISARVHPGEVPGSHTMNGIIDFLLSKDARAMLLRRNFVFMLVPMLNPDGVHNGHHRMDIFNQNLNRFYKDPSPQLHPGPFGIKSLAEHLQTQGRLCFFLDLHAHTGRSGNFFYGNALDKIDQQVETQLYAKLMSLNCVNFQEQGCNFSKRQMTSQDRNEKLTKEGCSRVAMYRISKLVYSYTLECGYHHSLILNDIKAPQKNHRKLQGHPVMYDELDNIRSPCYQAGIPYYTTRMYANLGKALLVSILDIFQLNPFSRVPNTNYKDLTGIRKEIEQAITSGDTLKKPISFKRNRLTAPENSKARQPFNSPSKRNIFPRSTVKLELRKQSIRIRDSSMPKRILKTKSK